MNGRCNQLLADLVALCDFDTKLAGVDVLDQINQIGIEPDVEVEFDAQAYVEDGTDNQLNKAIEVLQEKMAE